MTPTFRVGRRTDGKGVEHPAKDENVHCACGAVKPGHGLSRMRRGKTWARPVTHAR